MKYLFITFALLLHFGVADAQNASQSKGGPEIRFDHEINYIGTIKEGDVAEIEFRYRNTGNADLTITDVVPSCGCVWAEWNHETVKPGKTGIIKAHFKSADRPGALQTQISVHSNAPMVMLTIKGFVQPKPKK